MYIYIHVHVDTSGHIALILDMREICTWKCLSSPESSGPDCMNTQDRKHDRFEPGR